MISDWLLYFYLFNWKSNPPQDWCIILDFSRSPLSAAYSQIHSTYIVAVTKTFITFIVRAKLWWYNYIWSDNCIAHIHIPYHLTFIIEKRKSPEQLYPIEWAKQWRRMCIFWRMWAEYIDGKIEWMRWTRSETLSPTCNYTEWLGA